MDVFRSLSELSALHAVPWRWRVSPLLGLTGMIAILMNVQGDIAVLDVFLDLVAWVVIGAAWQ